MTHALTGELLDEAMLIISEAKEHEIDLQVSDFVVIDGDWLTLDGMDAREWLEAMTMD